MTRGDKLLAAAILCIAIIAITIPRIHTTFFTGGHSSAKAVIKAQGKIVREFDLSDQGGNSTFIVNGRLGPSTLEVEGKMIRMKDAPCPDRICVRQGWIENAGESIVCVPGEIMVRIEGAAPVDAVTR